MINTPKKHSLADLNELTRAIVSVCENEPAIAAAYLFGSYAKGRQKPDSDIDVAVLLDDAKAADFSVLAFTSAVERNLGNQNEPQS
jgi:predicted nucleotidyltransferase